MCTLKAFLGHHQEVSSSFFAGLVHAHDLNTVCDSASRVSGQICDRHDCFGHKPRTSRDAPAWAQWATTLGVRRLGSHRRPRNSSELHQWCCRDRKPPKLGPRLSPLTFTPLSSKSFTVACRERRPNLDSEPALKLQGRL